MSSLPTIGLYAWPIPGNVSPNKANRPHFGASGQSNQASISSGSPDELTLRSRRRPDRPQPAPKTCTQKVLGYIGYGISKTIAGGLYLVPDFIKKPIARTVQQKIDTWLASFKHDPNAPETRVFAHHELGHAIAAFSAELPMEGIHLVSIRGSAGGLAYSSEAQAKSNTPEQFYRQLITLMAGHGAELNQATPEQLQDLKFISQSRMHALDDIAKAIPLVREANEKGWLRLHPAEQIPEDIDLKRYVALIQKAGRNAEEQAQQRTFAFRVRDFMRLSIVQDALKTAQQIHAMVPAEQREQMAHAVAHSDMTLNRNELYNLLEKHVSDDNFERMQTLLKQFIFRQTLTRHKAE